MAQLTHTCHDYVPTTVLVYIPPLEMSKILTVKQIYCITVDSKLNDLNDANGSLN